MNRQQFQEALEKLKKAPKKVEVLQLVLNGRANAEIAELQGLAEGTVRKHISNLYKNFGIKIEFPGDKPLKDQLKALFLQHKPEWLSDYYCEFTTEISDQSENLIDDSVSSLVPSDSEYFAEIEEDLMSLAVSILEQLGFDQKFKMNRVSDCVGYRLKNPGTAADKHYQIFIEEHLLGLNISMNKDILEPYLLKFKYWVYLGDNNDSCNQWATEIAGIFLVIPGKEEIFLNSLQPKYWNILEVEGKTIGDVYLNDRLNPEYYDYTREDTTKKCLDGFNKNCLSDRESYLVIYENKEFNNTLSISISSVKNLKNFIGFFGQILMNI
jgi:hypothetical protein